MAAAAGEPKKNKKRLSPEITKINDDADLFPNPRWQLFGSRPTRFRATLPSRNDVWFVTLRLNKHLIESVNEPFVQRSGYKDRRTNPCESLRNVCDEAPLMIDSMLSPLDLIVICISKVPSKASLLRFCPSFDRQYIITTTIIIICYPNPQRS